MNAPLKFVSATAIYCVVHSLLASSRAKKAAESIFGHRARGAAYRAFFNVQSVLGLAALYAYARRLPSPLIYDVRGPARTGLRMVQAAGLLYAVWTARQVGISDLVGVRSLASAASGQRHPHESEAQGPKLAGNGMKVTGPFAASRHPLNFAPLPILWSEPTMTRNLLIFNALATVYLAVASKHEEARLLEVYGPAYEDYRRSGVPYFIPDFGRLVHEFTSWPRSYEQLRAG